MGREKLSFDRDWKFHYGDIVSVRNRWGFSKSGSWMQGPESSGYDDSSWRRVDLPHDFVIETKPHPYMERESGLETAVPAMEDLNNMHTTAGSFRKDVGWYRKHFTIPASDEGRKLYLIFDGIFRDSRIYLNDFLVRTERSGYRQIVCDITDTANYGGSNVLSVKVDARQPEGWFYEGGGIYRHVWLLKTEQDHIEDAYVWCETEPKTRTAQVHVYAELSGRFCGERPYEDTGSKCDAHLDYDISAFLEDEDGRCVAGPVGVTVCGERAEAVLSVKDVQLWDMEHPYLYQAVVRLNRGSWRRACLPQRPTAEETVFGDTASCCGDSLPQGTVLTDPTCVDEFRIRVGIRQACFDSRRGFLLNGKQVKLKGVCCHQNHGGLGTALPDGVLRYRILRLKEMGANAYRCSHYPPSSVLLDVCDELGMLVMDETRLLSSEAGDLAQLETMVRLARNHPSVILYSIGNEEAQSQLTPQGARIAGTMRKLIRRLDPQTPVTMGMLLWDLKNRVPIRDIHVLDQLAARLDVAGFNYQDWAWEAWHKTHPDQPMVCTEQGTFKSTRDCRQTNREKCHLAITDREADSYMKGAAQWGACRPDWMSGVFIWTGFDYYGEPKPFAWPAISSQFGAMDLCGYPKDFFYYYQAWWSEKPVLHVFPHWNGIPGEIRDICVFSNCREVELLINGRSLGRKVMERDGYLTWEGVSFEPGILEGIGYGSWLEAGGDCTPMRERLYTVGDPAAVSVSREYADGEIQIWRLEAVDAAGRRSVDADNLLTFSADGGVLLGSANGDPSDHEPMKSGRRRLFHGLAQVILRAGHEGKLIVEAQGLKVVFHHK